MTFASLAREALVTAATSIALYCAATFAFDAVHFALHSFLRGRHRSLLGIGALHQVHHQFLGEDLLIHENFRTRNLIHHRIPEYVTQVVVTLPAFLFLPRFTVWLVLAFETFLAIVGTVRGGLDSNHFAWKKLTSTKGAWFVDPAYHALHHVYPNRYLSSTTRLFDILFGTGCQIEGRRFAITGASGALGEPLAKQISREGGVVTSIKFGRDYDYGDYARLDPVLAQTDVLVLCHGSKVDRAMEANCASFVAITERFRKQAQHQHVPPEVWAVGSEIEAHPAWGNPELEIYLRSKRAYARHARAYFHDRSLLYRHIVPSAYTSPMGKGLISGSTAAAVALFFIRRGFRYVPVSYTGIALVNWVSYVIPPRRVRPIQ